MQFKLENIIRDRMAVRVHFTALFGIKGKYKQQNNGKIPLKLRKIQNSVNLVNIIVLTN